MLLLSLLAGFNANAGIASADHDSGIFAGNCVMASYTGSEYMPVQLPAAADSPDKFILDNKSLLLCITSQSGLTDRVMFHVNCDASCSYNCRYDSLKQHTDAEGLSMFLVGDDKLNYTVKSVPYITSATVVPLVIEYNQAGKCTLTVSGAARFEFRFPVLLKDKMHDKVTELRYDSVYTFWHTAAGKSDRFELLFNYPSVSIESDAASDPAVFISANRLIIQNAGNSAGEVWVYNTEGKLLANARGQLNTMELNINPKPGICIVKIKSSGKLITKKLLVGTSSFKLGTR